MCTTLCVQASLEGSEKLGKIKKFKQTRKKRLILDLVANVGVITRCRSVKSRRNVTTGYFHLVSLYTNTHRPTELDISMKLGL